MSAEPGTRGTWPAMFDVKDTVLLPSLLAWDLKFVMLPLSSFAVPFPSSGCEDSLDPVCGFVCVPLSGSTVNDCRKRDVAVSDVLYFLPSPANHPPNSFQGAKDRTWISKGNIPSGS